MTKKYIVFDVETTGFNSQKNEIIQLGAVKYDENDVEVAQFNQLIKPTRSVVSAEISSLTGIYPKDLADNPVMADILPDFLQFISGHLIVAHNASFDMSFLRQAVVDCGLEMEDFQVYDTLAEAKKLLKMPNYRLETFKDWLKMDLRSHDALNDCLVTAKLYQKLQELTHSKLEVAGQLNLFEHFDGTITEEIRRKLNLPITKDLFYYGKDDRRNWQKFALSQIQIEQAYSSGYGLSITLQNDKKVTIHSDFLREMQKSNFLSEIEKIE